MPHAAREFRRTSLIEVAELEWEKSAGSCDPEEFIGQARRDRRSEVTQRQESQIYAI
jgi:hypothetical protein